MPPRTRRGWPGDTPGHAIRAEDLTGKPGAGYFRVSSNPDQTEQKSVGDQETEYWPWVERTGVESGPGDVFKDDDRSASTFAHRQRENFGQLREAIAAGRYKILWFWATSRQTRGDVPLDVLADESAKHGVLWCINGQILNPASGDDHLFLTIHYIMDRQYSYRISKDARRGLKAIAYQGKPSGRISYGYRRIYDYKVLIKGKPKWLRDEANVFDGHGRPIENSPAYVVREIFDRIEARQPIGRIARDLEDRRIPTPRWPAKCRACGSKTQHGFDGDGQPIIGDDGRQVRVCPLGHGLYRYMWTPHAVLSIARNPVYIRKRIFQAESWRVKDRHAAILEDVVGQWPELVTEEQFWTVQQILSDPARLKWRPGSGSKMLLTGVAHCGECGSRLYLHKDQNRGNVPYYVCAHRSHAAMRVDWLDAYVEDRIVSWLADPAVHSWLWGHQEDDTTVAKAARADIERLEYQIEECRINGEDPDADAVFWERRSRVLTGKLKEARALAQPPSLAPELTGMVGPDAADKWWKLRSENLPAAKHLIRAVADVRVHKGIRGGDRYHATMDPGRVSWAWLTGPDEGHRVFGDHVPRASELAEDAIRACPEEPDRELARRVNVTGRTVQLARRRLEDAGEIPVIRRKGRGKPVVVSPPAG